MAFGNWITPSKVSGSGNDTVNISANSSNTGRNVRSTVVTFKAANCPDVERTVNQAGKPEFVAFDNNTASVAKTGGTVTITGRSNSSKLTFSFGTGGTLVITSPQMYKANGLDTNNGTAIKGDPGANAEYVFAITFSNISANGTIDPLTKQLIATDNAGNKATCTISQAAGDPTLSVSPEAVTIPWDASESKSFTVTSNTSWTVE